MKSLINCEISLSAAFKTRVAMVKPFQVMVWPGSMAAGIDQISFVVDGRSKVRVVWATESLIGPGRLRESLFCDAESSATFW